LVPNLEPKLAIGKVRTGAQLARQNFMDDFMDVLADETLGDLAHRDRSPIFASMTVQNPA